MFEEGGESFCDQDLEGDRGFGWGAFFLGVLVALALTKAREEKKEEREENPLAPFFRGVLYVIGIILLLGVLFGSR